MNNQDEQLLSQYLDGELNADQSTQLEQRLEQEPQLLCSLQRMQALNKTLKSTFNTPLARSVPARIINMLARPDVQPSEDRQASGTVVPFPGKQRKARWSFAIAASIVAASGLLLVQGSGQQLADTSSTGSDPVLAQILQTTPSRGDGWNTLSDGRQIRPLLSYARIEGGWCREYLLSDQDASWHGVACKAGEGDWKTEILDSQGAAESEGEYRTAGANDSDEVARFMDTSAKGIALSAEKEEELIATQWR
ncbi:MAG: negative regulator of sigma E activity [Halioglobus sp.]|jgi:negative regulator of sigma E activity